MKKISRLVARATALGLGLSLSFAFPAFAAYDDVSLTTDTVLSVNGITLNVSGSSAVIESIAVGGTTFTVTLQANANSTFQVTAPSFNVLATNQPLGISTHVCNATQSKLGYTASSSEVIATITPSATLCTNAAADTSGGTGTSRGGGGGGTPAPQASPVAQLVTSPNFSSMTPAEKQAAISQIRVALVSLIQQLLVLLNQQLQTMQPSGSY